MIRIFGFLIGAAAAIGMFLLILGVPVINLPETIVETDLDSVAQKADELKEDIEAVAIEVIDEVAAELTATEETVAESMDASTGEIAEATPAEVQEQAVPVTDDSAPDELQIAERALMQQGGTAVNATAENDVKWHAFWNPFRSRIAAEGFVGQLEKVTGLDYRVVKIKTGVYEVTFAYQDDAERRSKISQIASATGLDLPES